MLFDPRSLKLIVPGGKICFGPFSSINSRSIEEYRIGHRLSGVPNQKKTRSVNLVIPHLQPPEPQSALDVDIFLFLSQDHDSMNIHITDLVW